MKKLYFILLMSIFGFLNAQDYKTSLQKDFLDYTQLIVDKRLDETIKYMNPEMFKLVPKETLLTQMKSMLNDPEVEFRFSPAKILSIGEIKKLNNMNYVYLKYSNTMFMRFNGFHEEDSKEDKENFHKFMLSQFTKQFGEGNVKYHDETKFYEIFVVKDVIANSSDLKSWTFAVAEKDKIEFLKMFIPEEIVKGISN